ncbi:MAG: polysaccharide lyase family protein [Candidatus Sumerlaeota bacterium]|nr:polysaccharide lyase family protein [Candidatus Sumerlaeota bacterium]
MSGRQPEKGYTFAATVRGEGVVHHFINSFCSNSQIAYWPFTRSCPDLAVFWDLYLRGPMGKYLYNDLSLLSPGALEAHALLGRAYLFDNDPQRIRQWTDHTYLHIGEWGSANQYALAAAMLCQPPAPIKPPDPQWVHPDFEAKIAGQDRPCELRPFEEVRVAEDTLKSFKPLWTIGQFDQSSQEFSQEILDEATILQLLKEESTEPANQASLVEAFIEETGPVEEIIAKDDARVFTIGKDTAADWRAIQPGAWTVMGGVPVYKGQHHPRVISFTLPEPATSQDDCFIAALCDLDTHLPLFMTVEFNDHRAAVRCPIPAGATQEAKGERRKSSSTPNVILAFRAPSSWLRAGENRLIIHVEGASRATYDWLGFGEFPAGPLGLNEEAKK